MFAISFDMEISELRKHYGDPYNNAYYEISRELRRFGFSNAQGSLYLTENPDMANLFLALDALRKLPWFTKSVRDIRGFRVDNWSNFTSFMQQ